MNIVRLAPFLAWLACSSYVLRRLVSVYESHGEYSHAYLVPAVTAYLLFRSTDRDQPTTPIKPASPAPHRFTPLTRVSVNALATTAGVALLILTEWYANVFQPNHAGYLFLGGLGAIIALASILIAEIRTPTLGQAIPPIAFLTFALPLPDQLIDRITLPLKLLAATLCELLLRLFHADVFRTGVVLHLPQGTLGVEDACSGIRSIWLLLSVATALILLLRLATRHAIVLLLLAPVLAILGNMLRIMTAATAVLVNRHDWVDGWPHTLSGLVAIAFSGGILISLATRWQATTPLRPQLQWNTTAGTPPGLALPALLIFALGTIAQVVVHRHYMAAYQEEYAASATTADARSPFSRFPTSLGNYSLVTTQSLSRTESSLLAPSDTFKGLYVGPRGQPISLTLLFWAPAQPGIHGAQPFVGPHELTRCQTLAGWSITDQPVDSIAQPQQIPAAMRFYKMTQNDRSQLVASWRTNASRTIPRSFLQRFVQLPRSWNTPPAARHAAQFAVIVAIDVNTTDLSSATTQLRDFLALVLPRLPQYGIDHSIAAPP